MTAVVSNRTPVIRFLLEESDLNPKHITDSAGFPIVLTMVKHLNSEMIKLFHQKGGEIVNAVNEQKWNCLHWAAFKGDLELSSYLISIGVDFSAKDEIGRTPLDLATSQNHRDVIQEMYVNLNLTTLTFLCSFLKHFFFL